jgi:Flp pilus assembly protein protease CpaA
MRYELLIYCSHFLLIFLVLVYSLVHDLKFRRIKNKRITQIIIIAVFYNILEGLILKELTERILLIKVIIIVFCFFLSYSLYKLKILGGADVKIIIIIFILIPHELDTIKFTLIFFLTFCLNFLLISISRFLLHYFCNRNLFKSFFVFNKIDANIKKFYFLSFFKFIAYNSLNFIEVSKYKFANMSLIFNFRRGQFQALVKIRLPIMIEILITVIIIFVSILNNLV